MTEWMAPLLLSVCALVGDVGSGALLARDGTVGLVPSLSSGVLSISLVFVFVDRWRRRSGAGRKPVAEMRGNDGAATASPFAALAVGGAIVVAAATVSAVGFVPVLAVLYAGVVVARKGHVTVPLAVAGVIALALAVLGFNVALGLDIPLGPTFL